MANTINALDINLEGKNRARLISRKWAKDYTNIPNSALPANILEGLQEVYKFLSGEELSLEDYTFLVRAIDGRFKKVFSPAIFMAAENKGLAIKWGATVIPINIEDNALKIPGQKSKYSFKIKTMPVNGYDNVVIALVFNSAGTTYSMPFPVKLASLENKFTEEELEVAIEDGDFESLNAMLSQLPSGDAGEKEYSGSGGQMEGPVIKMVNLPTGAYPITAFRRYKNSYGSQHLLQAFTETPFKANVSFKNDDGEWENEIKTIEGKFILKANSSTNKKLISDPVITPETPATLTVIGEGEYNGNKYVKTELEVQAYTVDDEILSLNF